MVWWEGVEDREGGLRQHEQEGPRRICFGPAAGSKKVQKGCPMLICVKAARGAISSMLFTRLACLPMPPPGLGLCQP